MNKGDLCLVTGVSGYLASWVAKDLLDQGFRVRGTIRNLQDKSRIQILEKLLPGIELVAADLRAEEGWAAAVEGCDWVFHVASPQAVKTEKDRTGGAVSGMKYLLGAAFNSNSVRKIVLTSSEAAIAYGHPRSKQHFDESDWTNLDNIKGNGMGADYFRSKTLAERLAWEWANDRARNLRQIPIASVNPSFILGPSLVPWGRYSLKSFLDMIQGKIPVMLDMNMRMVDVRDCAQMHIAVMQNPQANGQRHLSFAVNGRMIDIANIVRRDYPHLGFTPAKKITPNWLFNILRLFSNEVASLYSHIGNEMIYTTQHPNIYDYKFDTYSNILADTIKSILEHGWITTPNVKKINPLKVSV